MQRRHVLILSAIVALLLAAVLIGINSSWLAGPLGGPPVLVAHRGLAQDFDRHGLTNETCTAARSLPTAHAHLENTLASMEAAFDLGADIVELDVHATPDDRLAVFHDWTLACRTEGEGRTRDHTLAELQGLDIGYGYTQDGGKTFPFRGRGIGAMPALDEVFARFPDGRFFVDIKANERRDGELVADAIVEAGMHPSQIHVGGGPLAVAAVTARLPVRSITGRRLKRCLATYVAVGWTGWVPDACGDSVLLVPANVAPWMWGWPNRFLHRMDGADSEVVLIGDWGGEGFTRGFDEPAMLDALGDDYGGGIRTDRLEHLAPAVRARFDRRATR